MRFWPKLILLLVVIALLAFVGARLFSMVMGLLENLSAGGPVTVDPQFAVTEPTPTPRVFTDQIMCVFSGAAAIFPRQPVFAL